MEEEHPGLAMREAMLVKTAAGPGRDLSTLRSTREEVEWRGKREDQLSFPESIR